MARPASNEYLKLRGKTWYVRCQYTPAMRKAYIENWNDDPGTEIVKSLRTPDRDVARFRARADIQRHVDCKLIAAADADPVNKWGDLDAKYEVQPGTRKFLDDGKFMVADEKHITFYEAGSEEPVLQKSNRIQFVVEFNDYAKRTPEYKERAKVTEQNLAFFRPPVVDLDTDIIDAYIRDRKPNKEDGALGSLLRTLADWKSISDKNFAEADRPDAQRLVDHMMEEHDIKGSRAKRIIAMVRCAISDEMAKKESRVSFNAFDIGRLSFPNEDNEGEIERPSYTQDDIEKMKQFRHLFTDEQWLMIVWHMSTSMRPKAIRSIVKDDWEVAQDDAGVTHKTRYYRVRHDKSKKYGRRDIAFPQVLLDATKLDGTPLLPEKIDGPLFTTDHANLLRQINSAFEQLGIHNEGNGKTFYSGRHRAKDMMLRRHVNEDMRRAIMGHSRRMDSHDLYGHGFTQFAVKEAIDKIGF